MPYTIAYGLDTESVEAPYQLVLATGPDEWAELDADQLRWAIEDDPSCTQPLVGLDDVLESVALALGAEGVGEDVIARALLTVRDAVGNNS